MRHHDSVKDEFDYLERRLESVATKHRRELDDLRAKHNTLLAAVKPLLPPCVVVKSNWVIADDAGDWFIADYNIYSASDTMKVMARRVYKKIFSRLPWQWDPLLAVNDYVLRRDIDELRHLDPEAVIDKVPTRVLSLGLRLGHLHEFEFLEFYEHPFGSPHKLTPCIPSKARYDAFLRAKEPK